MVNNTRFLIFPWVKVKNLTSKALSLAARQVSADWREQYGFKPVLLETFVDEELYQGTCYQAANWLLLGQTIDRGRMDRYHQHHRSGFTSIPCVATSGRSCAEKAERQSERSQPESL
ncbi:Druantia anti-phage system protein DruA [Candidatus Hakubella thermalkaliphila]|uniref:Druantia anti-phage system protein DruA n=1 Tax=Candidatus Hakubella thermalkaliphila TaxID=2754717 RepID=UPI00387ECC31